MHAKKGWRKMKRYKFRFDEYEIGILINSLMQMRNELIREGRYTDAVDELILKFANML